jgi:hypothetical protein
LCDTFLGEENQDEDTKANKGMAETVEGRHGKGVSFRDERHFTLLLQANRTGNQGREVARKGGSKMSHSDRMNSIDHNHSKYTILMVICCLIAIAGIAILSASGVVGSWGYYGLILLCPLGHFIIMSLMNRDSENHQKQRKPESDRIR